MMVRANTLPLCARACRQKNGPAKGNRNDAVAGYIQRLQALMGRQRAVRDSGSRPESPMGLPGHGLIEIAAQVGGDLRPPAFDPPLDRIEVLTSRSLLLVDGRFFFLRG